MTRRPFLLGGAGLLAGAGGLWWSIRREARDDPAAGLWTQQFARPDGSAMAMVQFRGRPLVLNFWATWCPPCIREMPALDRFQRQFAAKGWQVLGLALDKPQPVREFLERTPVSYTIALAGPEGAELSRRLGNERGGLPFTVVFDSRGRIVERKLGEAQFEEMIAWTRRV